MYTEQYISVLIIDDETITRFIHKTLVGFVNAKTTSYEAANGEEALSLLTILGKPFPDIMLIDLNMPLMNGFQFIEAFQKLGNVEDTMIVIVSSSINPDDVDRCRALGVKRVILKPLTLPYLQNIIGEAQRRRGKMVA